MNNGYLLNGYLTNKYLKKRKKSNFESFRLYPMDVGYLIDSGHSNFELPFLFTHRYGWIRTKFCYATFAQLCRRAEAVPTRVSSPCARVQTGVCSSLRRTDTVRQTKIYANEAFASFFARISRTDQS